MTIKWESMKFRNLLFHQKPTMSYKTITDVCRVL